MLENVAAAASLTAALKPDGTTLEIGLGNGHTLSVEGALFGTQAPLRLGDGDGIELESWVGGTLTTPVALQLGDKGGRVYGGAGNNILSGHKVLAVAFCGVAANDAIYDFRRIVWGRLAA